MPKQKLRNGGQVGDEAQNVEGLGDGGDLLDAERAAAALVTDVATARVGLQVLQHAAECR